MFYIIGIPSQINKRNINVKYFFLHNFKDSGGTENVKIIFFCRGVKYCDDIAITVTHRHL